MKIQVQSYTFDASEQTVTFTGYLNIRRDAVLLITNVTDGVVICNFADPTKGGTVVNDNELVLDFDTTSMSDSDDLQIWYYDEEFDPLTDIEFSTALSDALDASVGGISETPPATDTDPSALNGRLQRIAQNITTLDAALGSPFQAGGSIGNASFGISGSLPAGTNNIGDVDVLSLPALPAGNNNIGDVDIATIAAGDNNIGNVDVVTMPAVTINAIPAGTNNIGDVDVLTLPALPAGNNNIGDVDVASLPVAFNAGATSATTQRVVLSRPATYHYNIPSQVHVNSSSTVHWDLFNADAALIVRVVSIRQIPNITSAVTGIVFDWLLERTTSAGTGGSALTAWLADLNDTPLDADVTLRSKPTGAAAESTNLFNYSLSSEETNAATIQIASQGGLELVPEALQQFSAGKGIVLRQNQGIRCVQVTASIQGNTGWLISFVVE